jgi:hypothetical protein
MSERSERVDDLAGRLDEVGEEIADLAIDAIKAALRSGSEGRPVAERTLTQARRAVEKAAHLLRSLDEPPAADD